MAKRLPRHGGIQAGGRTGSPGIWNDDLGTPDG
jgi:hypothetical protein